MGRKRGSSGRDITLVVFVALFLPALAFVAAGIGGYFGIQVGSCSGAPSNANCTQYNLNQTGCEQDGNHTLQCWWRSGDCTGSHATCATWNADEPLCSFHSCTPSYNDDCSNNPELDCSGMNHDTCAAHTQGCADNHNNGCTDNVGLDCGSMAHDACVTYAAGCADNHNDACIDAMGLDCSTMNEGTCNSYSAGCSASYSCHYGGSGSCTNPDCSDCGDQSSCDTCVGSPGSWYFDSCSTTGSCDSFNAAGCPDNYGCDPDTSHSSCSTTGSCNSFDGQGNCPTSNGCSWDQAFNGCGGSPHACTGDNGNQTACGDASCTWWVGNCTGTMTCAAQDDSGACGGIDGCTWSEITDVTAPSIDFVSPTAANGSVQNASIFMNITTNDTNSHYAFVDFNRTLVVWMRMDETNSTGDPGDISGYNNNGTKFGDAALTTPSAFNSSFTFDGSGDYIVLPGAGLPSGSSNRTVSLWFKRGTSSDGGLFAFGGTGVAGNQFSLEITSSNLYFWGHGVDYQASTSLATSTWYHSVVVYNGTSVQLYLNGQDEGSSVKSLSTVIGTPYIGYAEHLGGFNGQIDEFMVFNRTLNASEVLALYNASIYRYQNNFTGWPDGNYTFRGHTVDLAGNKNQTLLYSVLLNTQLPNVTIDNASETGINATSITVQGTCTGDVGAGLHSAWTNSTSFGSVDASPSIFNLTNTSGVPQGLNTVWVFCNDTYGGTGSAVFNFTFDTVLPTPDFVSPTDSNGSALSRNYTYLNLTTTDANTHYAFVNFNDSLVLWYTMDAINSTGHPTDLSSSGNNGTNFGNAAQTPSGRFGKGFTFDGTGDYIRATSTNLPTGNANRTMTAWFKTTYSAADQHIVAYGSNTANSMFDLYVKSSSGRLSFTGNSNDIDTVINVANGAWQFAAVVNNGSGRLLYLNGTLVGADTDSINTASGSTFRVGEHPGTGSNFNGQVDDVMVFNRTLNSSEIAALYNASASQYFANFTALADANYTYRGYAVDAAGNVNQTQLYNILVDSQKPVPNVDNASGAVIPYSPSISIQGTCTGDAASGINVTYTNSTYFLGTNTTPFNFTNTSAIPDGAYTVYVFCNDSYVQSNFTTFRFTLDTVKPALAFNYPAPSNNSYISANYTYLNLTTTDANTHYAFVNFNDSLVLWYTMDTINSTGHPTDLSSSKNNGTKFGNAAQTANGSFGSAFTFDGTGDYIRATSTNLPTGNANRTMTAWFKTTTTSQRMVASYGGTSTSTAFGIYVDTGGTLTGGTWSNEITTSRSVANGAWQFAAFVNNGSGRLLYLNGTLVGADTDTISTSTSSVFRVGEWTNAGASTNFNGQIDDVMVFNRTLNSSEIAALYNASASQYFANFTGLTDRNNYTYAAYSVDAAGNVNTSTLTVNHDRFFPSFVSVTSVPNATQTDYLDPFSNVTIFANITDSEQNFHTVWLQWRNQTAGADWNNVTMTNQSQGVFTVFNATITLPAFETNVTYRILANDTSGQTNTSSQVNLTSYWDCTWNLTDSDFGAASGWNENKRLEVLNINNTGDSNYTSGSNCTLYYRMTYDLTEGRIYFDDLYFKPSTLYTITAGNNRTILINATFLSEVKEEAVNITVTDASGRSNTSSMNASATLISTTGGPYFYQSVSTYPASLNLTTQDFSMASYLRNIAGNGSTENNAYNITFNWSLPSGWLVKGGNTSFWLDNLTNSSPVYSNLNISFNSSNLGSMSAGNYSITIYSAGSNSSGRAVLSAAGLGLHSKTVSLTMLCYNTSDSICVTSCGNAMDPDCEAAATTTTTTSSGGGSVVSGSLTRLQSEALFRSSESSVDLVRGSDNSFVITITNPLDQPLTDVRINLSGYIASKLRLDTDYIGTLHPGESRDITVYVEAPKYLSPGSNQLTFTITGKTRIKGVSADFKETKSVALLVQDIPRDEAEGYYNGTEGIAEQFRSLGFPTGGIEDLFSQMRTALFSARDYSAVKGLYEQAVRLLEDAKKANDTITGNNVLIEQSQHDGVPTPKTIRLNNLAAAAFERGEFSLARSRAEEAAITYALETKGEFNLGMFLFNNWPQVSLTSIISLLALIVISFRVRLSMVKRRLRLVDKEEGVLLGLIKQVQRDCFEKAKMSMEEYMQAVLEYEDRLGKAVQRRIELETQKVRLSRWWKRNMALYQERERLLELMKQTQSEYMERGTIETHVYENRMKSLKQRLSVVEEKISFMEASKAIRKKMGAGRKLFV